MNATIYCWILSALVGPEVHTARQPETYLYVRTVPQGATITVDGKPVGTSNILLPISPGQHEIMVELAGYLSEDRQATAAAGKIARVELILRKAGEATVPKPPPDQASKPPSKTLAERRPEAPPGERQEIARLIKEAVSQAEAGDVGAAQETLGKARQIATKNTDEFLKDWMFAELAKAHAQMKDYAGAVTSVLLIRQAPRYIDTAYEVVIMQARERDFSGAKATHGTVFAQRIPWPIYSEVWSAPKSKLALEEIGKLEKEQGTSKTQAGRRPETPSGERKEVERLIEEAVRLAKEGEVGAAQETLGKARQIATKNTDEFLKDWMFAELAKAHAQLKDYAGAVTCVLLIRQAPRYIDTAYEVVIMQARERDFSGAKATHETLFREMIPGPISFQVVYSSKKSLALEEIRKLEKEQGHGSGKAPAPSIPQTTAEARKEVERLIKEGVAQAEGGDVGTAQETLARGVDTAKAIAQETLHDWCRGELARAYAQIKDFDGAKKSLKDIKDWERRSVVAYEVALLQARERQFAEARATAEDYVPFTDSNNPTFKTERGRERLKRAHAEIEQIEQRMGKGKTQP
jgi:tetratricopeptide (TPR) repeat protein